MRLLRPWKTRNVKFPEISNHGKNWEEMEKWGKTNFIFSSKKVNTTSTEGHNTLNT
jgi:hypothetical protein